MPCAPVTADRTPSMRTGLAASTVTAGRTAPEASRTTPVMLLCAHAAEDVRRVAETMRSRTTRRTGMDAVPPEASLVIRAVADVLPEVDDLGRRTNHLHHV